jgi:ribosomal-protein-alanine N-acetyltransferase
MAGLAPSTPIYLEVAEDNALARALYEKAGFVVNGTRPAYYRRKNGAVDAINYVFLPMS